MREGTMRQGMLAYLGAVVTCIGLSGCVFYLNPLCNDHIHNGEETDIDCGGSCGPCDVGASCRSASDCADSICVGGTCKPLPCANGVQDEQETDVDCGGGTCHPCAGARHCEIGSDCFSGTCVAVSNTCSSIAVVSFADAVPYQAGAKPYTLFSTDLNGDGRIDLAVVNEIGSSISVFLNNGLGTFTRQEPPFPTGNFPTGGTLADFNHDGILDLVTANFHGNSVSVLLNPGTGVLAPSVSYPTIDGGETSNLAVGDFDKDGNLDVIATNQSKHSVSQFMGLAGGTLAPAIDLQVGISGASAPFSAAIGDFNGDGKDDLAIGENTSNTIVVRLGNGNGTFQAEVPYAAGGGPGYVILATDLNLDGQLDLVSANRGSDNISVLLGRGDGTFRKAITSSTGAGSGPYSLAVADFNKDGVPDVITANFMGSNASVLLGIGDGHFEDPIDAGPTGSFCYGVAVGDFNGDGTLDFATANAIADNMTVKLSTSH